MEETLKQALEEYADIVEGIDTLEILEEEQIAKTKAKLRLFDGSVLQIRRIRVEGRLEAYSYNWLRPDGTTIVGWDNAPHHKEIATFPHHRHTETGIESSEETDILEVLKFIRRVLA
jgi:hypothetical protein